MHLHVPDGVLPPWLWGSGLALAVGLLVASARTRAGRTPQQVAYQGAIGALVLAAMAVEIPLGPLEYHLTLVGPAGVLLGPAASFQVIFVVNAILALLGHGGLTVVGLNAVVLGSGAALARPAYVWLARRLAPGASLALGTALAQTVSGALWLAVVGYALRSGTPAADRAAASRIGLVAALAFPMWLVGIAAESVVALGIARFLTRVRPDLLPAPGVGGEATGAEAA